MAKTPNSQDAIASAINGIEFPTSHSIEVNNDTIFVKQKGMNASDWVASIALIFTIISTIGTLVWQGRLRKKDKQEQRKIRNNDIEFQNKTRKKDDKMRQWNALYPHRLRFYTDFYDVLFKFVNYKGRIKNKQLGGGREVAINIISTTDLIEFCNLFNKFDEESKVLFDKNIQDLVHGIYLKMKTFIDKPLPDDNRNMSALAFTIENNKDADVSKALNDQLTLVQQNILDIKLDQNLRDNFKKALDPKAANNE